MDEKYFDLDLVDKVANKLGYRNPQYLASGSKGDAFGLTNSMVLKITYDVEEAKVANKLKTKNTKYLANYYDVRRLIGADIEFETFSIVLERCDLLDPEEVRIFDKILDWFYFDQYQRNEVSLNDINVRITEIDFKPDFQKVKKMFNDYYNILKEMKKYNIDSQDIHSGNLGFSKRTGNLVYFDVGYNRNVDKFRPVTRTLEV